MTQTRTILITAKDRQRLQDLIRNSREARSEGYQYLQALAQELSHAETVEPENIPADVVTMNSTVQVKVNSGRRSQTWTIVYPEDANVDEDRISVLAPLGTALLGYRAGDTVEWNVPAGRRRYRIVKVVHQPEAAGNFDR